MVIFSWSPLDYAKPKWNIDRLCADDEAIELAGEYWRELNGGRGPLNAQATTIDLEAEACWMQDSLKAVLDRHASGKPPSARLKRWWTGDVKDQRRRFGRASRDYNCDRISFGEYRQVRNDYYRHIRRAERVAWESFLQGAGKHFDTRSLQCLHTRPQSR